jgi:hypothetical protein
VSFVRVQRGVNPAEHHERTGLPCGPAEFVAAERIARVDADADDVPLAERGEIERLQGFIGDDRVTNARGVAAAMTNSQRGVMTPTPNETWLGLTRCTCNRGPRCRKGKHTARGSAGGTGDYTGNQRACRRFGARTLARLGGIR